jgi:hypothetical protein
MLGFVAGYALIPKNSGMDWGMALLPGATAFALLIMGVRRRWGGSLRNNWFIVACSEGYYINSGYSSGYAWKKDASPIVFIPHACVHFATPIYETIKLPNRLGVTRHHLVYLDISLRMPLNPDIEAIIQSGQENFRHARKTGPYPVRMILDKRLRLNWDAVVPDVPQALEHFKQWTCIHPGHHIHYPDWDALDIAQRELFLDELWEMGMHDDAAFLGRIHYKTSLTEAGAILQRRKTELLN